MPQENYFAGGIYSLRGYRMRSVGPTERVVQGLDPDSLLTETVVGGNKQLLTSLELEVPLIRSAKLNAVIFYDGGNIWAQGKPWFASAAGAWPFDMLHDVGYGLRWQSPMGPLRFEVGYPLTPRSEGPVVDEPTYFEFTIGGFF